MITLVAKTALILSIAAASAGHAQTYSWRDAHGLNYSAAEPPKSVPANLRSVVGTNLDGIAYWSPQIPFIDVMKMSSPWISGDSSTWDNGQALDLDSNGWVRSLAPGQIARKLTLRETGDRYPAGQYLVKYRGEGTLRFGFAAKVVSEKPGELLLQVTPASSGVYLTIQATNPSNYLRDIEIVMPGGICEGDPFTHVASAAQCGGNKYLGFANHHRTILFYPVFANRLRGYSTLRFMDWMHTNNSSTRAWSRRTPMPYSTWATPTGAPIEVMVALANLVGAHPWFTIPHQADDSYIENFAAAVGSSLDPNLRVYAEHSNEVWNSQFSQYRYAVEQGKAQTPSIDNMQYHALRSRAIGKIFKRVLGESRVTTVLGAQAASTWTATHGLEHLRSRFAADLGIDAVAIAPYFGVSLNSTETGPYEKMELDDLFPRMAQTLAQSEKWVAAYRDKVANAYKVRLVAYEGGQHMIGIRGGENNEALNKLFDDFNRDARIKDMYLEYLQAWKRNGGELFVHYNDVSRYTKWGRWGALEYITQPREAAPKFDAIQTFIEQNPVWWKQ
jgi:hypothetical protein